MSRPRAGWVLPALILVAAAALRLATLDAQSLWFDEAFTPVHVLHGGLGATLRSMAHTENTPPLWYVLDWGWTRLLGTGAVAMRSLSALAGVGLVGVGWLIGRELAQRRAAVALAALLAVNPLMVWYSQEARAYELLALLGGLSYLFYVRVRRRGARTGDLVGWAAFSALALLTHYFAIFLVAAEAVGLLLAPGRRRGRVLAVASVAVVGAALVPLALSQGGHGAQWIGRWALGDRLIAIGQYYVLGYYGNVLGHALLALALLPLAGIAALGIASRPPRAEADRALEALAIGVAAILAPLTLALFGADYLAPRNLVAAWVPVTASAAVVLATSRHRAAATAVGAIAVAAGLAVVLATSVSPRLQRGDWRGLAHRLPGSLGAVAVVTPQLGSSPLEYYRPLLGRAGPRTPLAVAEIDLVGYRPLRAGAGRPPVAGFALAGRAEVHGLLLYRFTSPRPVAVSERALLAGRITAVRSEVLAAVASSRASASQYEKPVGRRIRWPRRSPPPPTGSSWCAARGGPVPPGPRPGTRRRRPGSPRADR